MRNTLGTLCVVLFTVCLLAGQDNAQRPTAIIETSAGDFTCELFPEKAPLTVKNFVGLATGTRPWRNPKTKQVEQNKPLYNGTYFHRVVPGAMIQGGDPTGSGLGGPGYVFKDEITDLKFDKPGRLAMANRGRDSNGSQFFITEEPLPHLNGRHTIFGECKNSRLVAEIASRPRNSLNDRPQLPVVIQKIVIKNYTPPAATVTTTSAATPSPTPTPTPQP